MFSSMICCAAVRTVFFFFNDPATTEIYTLSLHDALPILRRRDPRRAQARRVAPRDGGQRQQRSSPRRQRSAARDHLDLDRKSTRLNSSHSQISYAVFCLKKKKKP